MSGPDLTVNNLCYRYPDGTEAIRGVSFRVAHGESVAIVGANGAGKSTLLLHLNGCLEPSEGSIFIGSVSVAKKSLPFVRRSVGMVFQDPDDQLFMPSVYDDVAFGPANMGLAAEDIEKRVEEALRAVDALYLRDRPTYRLSQGEKRRAAIASVLSMNPDILVLDEPGSALDPRGRKALIALLKTFLHTKILATHDLDMVMDLCERTIILHEGRVLADGFTEKLLSDQALLSGSGLEKPLRLEVCPVCGHGDPPG